MQVHFSNIFCDDIRQEINGKFTLVGCYARDLQLSDPSKVLERLFVNFHLTVSEASNLNTVKISLRVSGEEAACLDIDEDISRYGPEDVVSINGGMRIDPKLVQVGKILLLVAVVDGKEFNGAELVVMKKQERSAH